MDMGMVDRDMDMVDRDMDIEVTDMHIEVRGMGIEIRDMAKEDKEKDIASIAMTIEVRQNGITDHLPDSKHKKFNAVLAINKSDRWQE